MSFVYCVEKRQVVVAREEVDAAAKVERNVDQEVEHFP